MAGYRAGGSAQPITSRSELGVKNKENSRERKNSSSFVYQCQNGVFAELLLSSQMSLYLRRGEEKKEKAGKRDASRQISYPAADPQKTKVSKLMGLSFGTSWPI